jgi:hypothetical protein
VKKIFKILNCCVLAVLILYACDKREPDPEDIQPLTVDEARNWYETTQPAVMLPGQSKATNVKSSPCPIEIASIPIWAKAMEKHSKRTSIVELPVASHLMRSYGPKPEGMVNSFSRLIVRRDLQTGNTSSFVMTVIGDSAYMLHPDINRRMSRNRYFSVEKEFCGRIYLYDLEGRYMKGFRYEDGKRVGKISYEPSREKSLLKSYETYCWPVTRPVEELICEREDTEEFEIYCDWVTTGYEEYTECYPFWVDDPEDPWGSWGGDDDDDYDYDYDYGGGNGSYYPPDCAGVPGGGAYTDACGRCVGGTTGLTSCTTTPTVNPLYKSNSTLGMMDKKNLDDALTEFKNKYPVYTALYDTLLAKGLQFTFNINPSAQGRAQYVPGSGAIEFKTAADIACEPLKEELIHAIQYDTYGSAMTVSVKNYEYEAKVFQDLACLASEGMCPEMGGINLSSPASETYYDWIEDILSLGVSGAGGAVAFNYYCSNWSGYGGTVDYSFTSQILSEYFGN